ncbi:MAG: hypothetical protein HZA78_07565 [Candidatus Schekmanbacteria bacterium]|nr:hypothetical protein [Candidatus Schekmanbacteria bacterium]
MTNSFQKFFQNLIQHGLEYFGLFYGCYRGMVVDNNDPEMLGRLKISCSALYGDDVPPYWAWPKVPFAGNQIGFFAISQVGDGVYIECEYGNPKYPIWSGGWWAKPNAQNEVPEVARLSPPTNRVWQTTAGHKIELDDTPGAEKIKITDKSGNYILIDSTTRNEEHLIGGKKINTIALDKEETVGGNWNVTVAGKVTITAPEVIITGGLVKLSSQAALHKLVVDTFLELFNNHTHNGIYPGSGNSDVPNQQAGAGYKTLNTEAS